MDIPEIEQDVADIGHVFKRYTTDWRCRRYHPLELAGAHLIHQGAPGTSRGKHGCIEAVAVYAAYGTPNF
jgi:hypothetical protein